VLPLTDRDFIGCQYEYQRDSPILVEQICSSENEQSDNQLHSREEDIQGKSFICSLLPQKQHFELD